MHFHARRLLLSLSLLSFVLTGCSTDAKKARYLEQADRYFQDGKYDEAEIDYKNVLQLDGQNVRAIGQLGMIYLNEGSVARSIPFIAHAQQAQPNDLSLRLKLGMLQVIGNKPDEARKNAEFVLAHDPKDPEAPLLLAETVRTSKDAESARTLLQGLPAPSSENAPTLVALGIVAAKQGKLKEAKELFQRAVAKDPKFGPAHMALGNIARGAGDVKLTESEYKAGAEASPLRSTARGQYAEFKIQSGDIDGGRQLLLDMINKTPDYLPASLALAQLDLQEKKYSDATQLTTKILSRDPGYPEALLLVSKISLAQGHVQKAIGEAEKLVKMYPQSPLGFYQLAIAQLAAGQTEKASASLRQTLTLAPSFPDAIVMQAGMNLTRGNNTAAIADLKGLLAQRPDLSSAWFLLVNAQRAQGNADEALATLAEYNRRFPRSADAAVLEGTILAQQRKFPAAKAALAKALEYNPDLYAAQEQLAYADLAEGNGQAALQRLDASIQKHPRDAARHVLQARVYIALKDSNRAEAALQKAIELNPGATDAYYLLANLYSSTGQSDKAIANLNQAVAKDSSNARAFLMLGLLQDQKKNYPAARDAYEKVVALDPRSVAALNNLAFLYADAFHDLDKAQDAAQKARDLAPNEPHVADTLGWILFLKKQYVRADGLLQEAAGKLSDSATVQYHFGMASYMTGDEEAAKAAFQRALQFNPKFAENEAARQRLSVLNFDLGKASSSTRETLEKELAEFPDDPFVLSRLGALYEREGNYDSAVKSYEAALKVNNRNTAASVGLIRSYTAKNDFTKALEAARAARKVNTDDPELAKVAGRAAFQARDFAWANTLLQEAAGRQPDDASLQFDLGEASYAVGNAAGADDAMRAALKGNLSAAQRARAQRFLELRAIAADPSDSKAASVAANLGTNPNDVAALMAQAALDEKKNDSDAAQKNYEKALAQYPDFVPAMRGLAIIYARDPANDAKAYQLGLKARETFTEDPALGRAFGMVLYRRGEFSRAASILSDAAANFPNDAEVAFYLGMSQSKLKNAAGAKQSLQRALDLHLNPALAANAKKTLESLK